MKTLKELFTGKLKNILWLLGVIGFGALMYYLLVVVFTPFGAFSRFPAAILLMYIGVGAWIFMDKVWFSSIDTVKALRDGNMAYAVMMLAISIIVAAVISTV